MKRIFFFSAIFLFLTLLTSSCDKNDDVAPKGDIVLADMAFSVQFESTMDKYLDIQVSWFDNLGVPHTAAPEITGGVIGNRFFSNVSAQYEYLDFPVDFVAVIRYKLREGVELPEEGFDIIVFWSAVVNCKFENGVMQKTTKDGFSYTKLKVTPSDLEDEIDFLNDNCSLAYLRIGANGNVTIESLTDDRE